jgi:hypothetical protein
MDDEQNLIWDYLNENAIGFDNRKSSEEIRLACNLISGGPTNDHVREKIRFMVNDHGCCIGSVSWVKGFWTIVNEEELNRVTNSLEARANKVLERADILRTN